MLGTDCAEHCLVRSCMDWAGIDHAGTDSRQMDWIVPRNRYTGMDSFRVRYWRDNERSKVARDTRVLADMFQDSVMNPLTSWLISSQRRLRYLCTVVCNQLIIVSQSIIEMENTLLAPGKSQTDDEKETENYPETSGWAGNWNTSEHWCRCFCNVCTSIYIFVAENICQYEYFKYKL